MQRTTDVRLLSVVLIYFGFCASTFLVLLWIGDEGSRADAWSFIILIAALVAYPCLVVSTNDPQAAQVPDPEYESEMAIMDGMLAGQQTGQLHPDNEPARERVVDSVPVVTTESKQTGLVSGPDPHLRARVREQLGAEGFDVVEAESDEEAWELYQAEGVDRIVVAACSIEAVSDCSGALSAAWAMA